MKIIIECTEKEIAALVVAIQEQQNKEIIESVKSSIASDFQLAADRIAQWHAQQPK